MAETIPITFASENTIKPDINSTTWKLFIVDDDKDIHSITKLALKDLKFKDMAISFESAYSAKEAIDILKERSDFAIVLLDISMETRDSGLDVARFIRKNLNDAITRIIIRTGQPGDVPEKEIIDNYDINDYKSKTDLTIEKLFISIRTAIAQYAQISELAILNEKLEDRVAQAIAKQKEQQEKLFIQNRNIQMNELLNIIAHQWRQPLSRISAVTSQLKFSLGMGGHDNDNLEEQIHNIEKYTRELSATIDEFRKMYEPSQRTCSITLRDLLERSASIISTSFQEQNILISVQGRQELLQMMVTGELYQVILNILKNSQEAFLEHKPSSAKIDIDILEVDGKVHIKIKDNAGGIDADDLSHIFDPYFSTKQGKNGHGLGLYMSKSIIEQQYHGKLLVENSDNGVCSTIIIPKG